MIDADTILRLHHLEIISIATIQDNCPSEGYWVAFSGGKDSIVMYDLVKRAGVKYDVHFNKSSVDPPEVLTFLKENYPEVKWEQPKRSMFKMIRARQVPPTSVRRYCCREIKELHGNGRVVCAGVRSAESVARAARPTFGNGYKDKETWFCFPIKEWEEQDIWDYIKLHDLKYPALYDEGYKRLGCIMCPMQNRYGMAKDAVRFPKFYNAYLKAFAKMLQNCKEKGKGDLVWQTPEDVMFWWIYKMHRKDAKSPDWKLPTEEGFDLEKIKPRPYNKKRK